MINRRRTVRPDGISRARIGRCPERGQPPLPPGKVMLRDVKRPRPIVLRVNRGDFLQIHFRNLLTAQGAAQTPAASPQNTLRHRHALGLRPRRRQQLVDNITDDGTFAGANPRTASGNESGIVAPGGAAVYTLYAAEEGTFLLYSMAADYNAFRQMQLMKGLFGAVNVEPEGAEWYRSQVTAEDLASRHERRRGNRRRRRSRSQSRLRLRLPEKHPRAVVHPDDLDRKITCPQLSDGRLTGPPRHFFERPELWRTRLPPRTHRSASDDSLPLFAGRVQRSHIVPAVDSHNAE